MIAAHVAGASAGAANRASGGANEAAPGKPGDDSGFAGLLASPSATPAARSSTAPAVKQADTRADAEDDPAAETPDHPMLPEQLLALIAASPAAPAAGRAPATAATAAAAAAALAADPAAVTFAAPGPGVAGSATAQAALPTVGTANGAAAPTPPLAGSTAAPPDTSHVAAIPLADFAKTLGLAAADAAGATSSNTDSAVPDIGDRSSLLAPATSPALAAARAAATATAPLALPTGPDAGFDDAFGARIGWLADQRIGRAEIRLNPEHLGAIEVRLQIDGSRVTAEFQSAHADVRHALENSVGRLREMLAQQGLQLAQADVGQGRSGGHGERSSPTRDADSPLEHDAHMITHPTAQPLHSRGLLDEYA